MTNATSGAGTANLSGVPEFITGVGGIPIAQSLLCKKRL